MVSNHSVCCWKVKLIIRKGAWFVEYDCIMVSITMKQKLSCNSCYTVLLSLEVRTVLIGRSCLYIWMECIVNGGLYSSWNIATPLTFIDWITSMTPEILPLIKDFEELLSIGCDRSLNSRNSVNKLGAEYDICVVEHPFFKRNHNELQSPK